MNKFIFVVVAICVTTCPVFAQEIPLENKTLNIEEVIITAENSQEVNIINKIDKTLRPINSAQDLLNLIPGLFIAQHAGGGKAEQIFYRGFDHDHGTDFNVSIDGLPVNMVSHAHGQGYADFHFVIPETIDELKVYAGPFSARFGDFATSGAGAFTTKNYIRENLVKLEAGQFNTYRALAMFNVLDKKHLFSKQKENAYLAAEYNFTNAYFQSPQDFNRLNLLGKYSGVLSDCTSLTLMGSYFDSKWNASGQIPERAVNSGKIDRFGYIDDTEGGKTNRSNAYATLSTKIGSNGLVKNQLYFVNYGFSLFSNFTFFLEDSVHGDGINQRDQRNIYGYNGTYEQAIKLGKVNLRMLYGATARVDEADLVLQRQERRTLRDIITAGHLNQENVAFFTEQTLELDSKYSIIAGLRFDYFNFKFKHIADEALSGDKAKNITSPKLSFLYDIANNVQLYLKGGIGFHSNDARDVVRAKSTDNVLPKAYSAELGSTFKIGKKALANIALYRIDLESELVYVGDAGEVEAKGATERYGIDVAIRYQLLGKLFLDVNGNYAKGKFKDLPNGENNIPLAPRLSSTGGISYKQDRGFNAAIRYRYIADRPANELNSVIAKGYFLLDAVANYSWAKTTLGLSVENVLNVKWNQAQFDTESRLRGENVPVSELHFTPGTPFFLKGSVAYRF